MMENCNDGIVEITLQNNYGKDKAYPANKSAHLFAAIAGTTTLTQYTLKIAEQLGFEIRVARAEVKDLLSTLS